MIRRAVTENGIVEGMAADDPRITVYRGIPYAKPPVGALRWRAPETCENWDGVRMCHKFAPIPMQDRPGTSGDIYCREFHVDPDIPISEDSLYLNVWTGAKSSDEKLPVLVWIYGGAFQWGYTQEPEFNGERLARHGVIVVSAAYRLGVFGFFAHPDLTREDPAHPSNFGLLDQQAALMWVYRNIAAFGGDPDNITLAGQSAGGASVAYALAAGDNAKIIKKATVFSGFIRSPFFPDDLIRPRKLEDLEKLGEDFLSYLGCAGIDEARDVSAEELRDAYFEYARSHPRFVPCIDNVYAKDDPIDIYLRGDMPDVPLLTGYTKDEFIEVLPTRADATDEVIKADIIEKGSKKSINIVQNTVRRIADAHTRRNHNASVYTYKFAPAIPGYDDPGDFHSCDLWFFFETIQKCWRPYDGKHYELARTMCDYWTNFIKTGDPNGKRYDGADLPLWNKTTSGTGKDEMIFR